MKDKKNNQIYGSGYFQPKMQITNPKQPTRGKKHTRVFVAKGFQTHWKESFAHLMLNKAKLKIFLWISTRQKGTNHHKPMLLFVCSVELKMYKTNQSQYLYAVVLKVYKHILYSILSINQPHDSKRWNCKSFVESLQQACSGPWRPNRRNRNCGPRSFVSY